MTYTGVSSVSSNWLVMSSPSGGQHRLAVSVLQQVRPRIGACGRVAERLQRIPRLVVQFVRDLDVHGDEHVAERAVLTPDALAADPEGAAIRRPGRNPQADRHAAVRRYLDLRAEGGLGERHRDGDCQVGAGAAERSVRVRLDVHTDVEVARRPAALTRCALAGQLDALAVGDACRDPGLDRPGAHRPSATRAFRARVVDDETPAAAGLARLGEREAAQVPAALAGALAGRADPRHCAGLSAGAPADLTGPLPGEPERNRRSIDGIAERQRCLRLDVRPAPRPGLASSRGAATAAEDAA